MDVGGGNFNHNIFFAHLVVSGLGLHYFREVDGGRGCWGGRKRGSRAFLPVQTRGLQGSLTNRKAGGRDGASRASVTLTLAVHLDE